MTEKKEAEPVRMVAFRTHLRGDGRVNRGDEFEATEQEALEYATRNNPLAGPLMADEVAPRRRTAPPVVKRASARKGKGK